MCVHGAQPLAGHSVYMSEVCSRYWCIYLYRSPPCATQTRTLPLLASSHPMKTMAYYNGRYSSRHRYCDACSYEVPALERKIRMYEDEVQAKRQELDDERRRYARLLQQFRYICDCYDRLKEVWQYERRRW